MAQPPFYSLSDMPGPEVATPLEWEDLVLDAATRRDVEEIGTWLRRSSWLMDDWRLARHLKPGFAALFCGPSGTGKTLAAALIGKAAGRTVVSVIAARLQSDSPGGLERNVDRLLAEATKNDWILLFDDAGERVPGDRAPNRHVGYVLQRVEDYPLAVIVATNTRSHMDEAFARRFQSIVHFAMPGPAERAALWRNAFGGMSLADDVDTAVPAEKYAMSGGEIVAAVRHAATRAAGRGDPAVRLEDVQSALAAWQRRRAWTQGPGGA
ncbi:MAG TPA: ATP-binding protein [Rhizomicrobium sp.]|nr:ATP-binding protein [Rhizomicrobium sp.]